MKHKFNSNALIIEYRNLGTISMRELANAIVADLVAIREEFGIQYAKNVRLTVPATNEYGEPIKPRRASGASVEKIDTFHYRPSVLDYE